MVKVWCIYEEWREGTGPVTARQPAKARCYSQPVRERWGHNDKQCQASFWGLFSFQGQVSPWKTYG